MKYAVYIITLLSVLMPTAGAALEDGSSRADVSSGAADNLAVLQTIATGAADRLVLQRTIASHSADASTLPRTSSWGVFGDSVANGDISEDVRRAAVDLFSERFPNLSTSLQVRVERIGSKFEGASAVRVRLNHSESIPKGHTQVRLLAQDGEAWSDAGWALLYVAHFDSIAIAQNNVSKNDAVRDGDITFAWMETTRFRGVPMRPADYRDLSGDGLFAERPLRSGESVRVGDIRPAYAADTGQSITMTYTRNGLVLTLTCQAREPGLAGDVIRAYSPDTKATYKVELTGPGTADWISTL